MEEKTETEITKIYLPEDARDRLTEISGRLKAVRETIGRISKPEPKKTTMPKVLVTILLLPFLLLLFAASLVLAVWLFMHPLDTTAMFGISIVLIGCYTIILSPKRGN